MTKAEFVEHVQQSPAVSQLSKKQTTEIVDRVFEVLADALRMEQRHAVHHFGTFRVRQRAARAGRHPQTGAPLKIKASTTVTFSPASALKNTVTPKPKRSTARKRTKK